MESIENSEQNQKGEAKSRTGGSKEGVKCFKTF